MLHVRTDGSTQCESQSVQLHSKQVLNLIDNHYICNEAAITGR